MERSCVRYAAASCTVWTILAVSAPIAYAGSLTFNVSYDTSVTSAPSGFKTAFQYVTQYYQNTYSDPITINIDVGWGEIKGGPLSPGLVGQSSTNQQAFFTYATVRKALIADAKTAADATAIANLPATYPSNSFVMSNAEAKALGLYSGSSSAIDGWVGFNSSASYTFDPNNRAVPGKYDFIALAAHEVSEVMGRYGLGQNGASSGRFSPIDLFRYLSPGKLDTTPANGAYFSINGGNTNLNTFNGTGGGDLSDWAGLTADAFDHDLTSGAELPISSTDLMLLDVIGYDQIITPEPSTMTLFVTSVIAIGGLRIWWRKTANAAD